MICVKMIRLAFGGSGGNDIVLKHDTYQSINILNGKYGDSNILSEFTHYYKNVVQPNTLNIDVQLSKEVNLMLEKPIHDYILLMHLRLLSSSW